MQPQRSAKTTRRTVTAWRLARGRALTAIATALLAAGLALLAASPAFAGGYQAAVCDPGLGAGHADADYQSRSPRFIAEARCRSRGLVVRHEAGRERFGRRAGWRIAVPIGTSLTRFSARLGGSASDGYLPELTMTGARGAPGERRVATGSRRARIVRWSGLTRGHAWAGLRCARRSGCGRGEAAVMRVRRLRLTLRDDVEPRVAPAGELLASGSRRGTDSLALSAGDVGSGLHRLSAEVNGRVVATRMPDCRKRGIVALRLVPCPRRLERSLLIDTTADAFRQGPNQLRLCAADWALASRHNIACETRRVRVDNACPVSELGGATGLEARVVRGRHTGRRPTGPRLIGRLLADGAPAPGREVCVAARTLLPGRAERVLATPRTGPDGRFSVALARGPNRELRVAHWPTQSRALERIMRLKAKARPRLRVRPRRLRNGESVSFRVRLPGPANAGVRVRIQARSSGRWVDVRAARSAASGVARTRYRFTSTTERRAYRFRAVVSRQHGYPYLTGRSPSRRVVVRPR